MDVWFPLFCKPRKDSVAEANLIAQGVEVYRPLIRTKKECGQKPKTAIIESLFPRYLFIKVDPEKTGLLSIAYTRGVAGFIKFGNKYSTVDETLIDNIQHLESQQETGFQRELEYKKNELVYINNDSFSDVKAAFSELCGNNRVSVLLSILGRTTEIVIPADTISKKPLHR